ncbi:MAG: hypothetical protein Q9221_004636 [Calogaya cf. arnoldii]
MNPPPWPEILLITASDLKSYVNQNRNHIFTLLQSVATSVGHGPMVELPRGPLLVFLTNIIGMCNITPFQAGDNSRLEALDSVNAKLTTFHNFIQESRITYRMYGQYSDKNNAPTGIRGGREEQVNRVEMVPKREDKSQDVNSMMDVSRTENTITAEVVRQDQVVSNEQNWNPGTHLDAQRSDDRIGREGQKERGNRRGEVPKIEKVNAHTDLRVDKPSSQNMPPKGQGQVRNGVSVKHLDSQPATNLNKGEGQSDFVSHKTQNETVGMVNLHSTRETTQAPQSAVEDRIPTSQGEIQTQDDIHSDEIVTAEMIEVVQSGEEAALVDPLTQAETVEWGSYHAITQTMEDVHSNVAEGRFQDDYGTERQGSQGDDELSADDVEADKASLSQQVVVGRDDLYPRRDVPVEDDVSLHASGCTDCGDESDSTEERDEVGPTPDTTMSDILENWREGLAKSDPPETLENTERIESAKPLLAPVGTTRRPERSREVRVRLPNAEIASEVKTLTNIKLKECLDREVKNKKANIDHCRMLPSGEIRIWMTDDRGAQMLRQVPGWMPGAFGGLQIQRKNSNVVVPKL